jgi:ATPase subunit of ABC transporter with duplicated ATPase domains
MSPLLTLESVALAAPDGRILVDSLDFSLGRERVGLVGRNGVGKTSLLRVILGEIAPARGTVQVGGRVAALRQTLAPPEGSTLADLIGVAGPLAVLDRIEAGTPRGEDLDQADWLLPQRARAALARVGLGRLALDRPGRSLSGGQITRAALAGVLLAEPDLILLDEPTNNLDREARGAVAELLDGWEGAALVVSHDRELLAHMDAILELSSLGARVYGGGWDLYEERRAAEALAAAQGLETAARDADRVAREIQHGLERKARSDAAGRRARAKGDAPKMLLDARAERAEATGARQGRLADRRRDAAAAALEAAQARVERLKPLVPDMPASGLPAAKLVLAFEDVAFAWPGDGPILRSCDLRLTGPERLAVVGRNGSGKSTLLRLASGELEPTRGRIRRGTTAARLDQHAALLRDEETLVENFRRLNPAAGDNAAHAALARFLFRNSAALKPAGALSGGERLRAALACTLMRPDPPQLLILDEPTNHLDLASIEAIEQALAAYDGALLVVSHDERFLEAVRVEGRMSLNG